MGFVKWIVKWIRGLFGGGTTPEIEMKSRLTDRTTERPASVYPSVQKRVEDETAKRPPPAEVEEPTPATTAGTEPIEEVALPEEREAQDARATSSMVEIGSLDVDAVAVNQDRVEGIDTGHSETEAIPPVADTGNLDSGSSETVSIDTDNAETASTEIQSPETTSSLEAIDLSLVEATLDEEREGNDPEDVPSKSSDIAPIEKTQEGIVSEQDQQEFEKIEFDEAEIEEVTKKAPTLAEEDIEKIIEQGFIAKDAAELEIPKVESVEKETSEEEITEEETAEEDSTLPEITLEELPEQLQAAAAKAGWTSLMPVQAKAIPYVLAKRDLMVQSRTGSGKTGAFILPILERINPNKKHCQALILAPTRELASQVAKEAEILGEAAGVHSVAVYGGVGYGAQLDALGKGAQLVIGTPGRILDHLLRRSFNLDRLQILVFDEADRMLSMGFYPDMREVKRYLPRHAITSYMFSATYPSHVMRLAGEFLREPEFLSLSQDQVHVAETEHVYYMTPAMKKDRSLIRLIEMENPTAAIIFCNTRNTVHYLAVVLQRFGYDADELSADLNQNKREQVLGRVRKGTLRFLVATDVAARGIDIPELSHVFQYDPPEDPEAYIHRAGRTGRAGASGKAIVLAENITERLQLDRIAKRYSIDMQEMELPSDDNVAVIVAERLNVLLEARLRTRDRLHTERMQRFVTLGQSLAESEEGQNILAMLLDDQYQQILHAPPEAPKEVKPKQEAKKSSSKRRKRKKKKSSNPESSPKIVKENILNDSNLNIEDILSFGQNESDEGDRKTDVEANRERRRRRRRQNQSDTQQEA